MFRKAPVIDERWRIDQLPNYEFGYWEARTTLVALLDSNMSEFTVRKVHLIEPQPSELTEDTATDFDPTVYESFDDDATSEQ